MENLLPCPYTEVTLIYPPCSCNNSSSDEPKVAYIEFEGEGVVTAAEGGDRKGISGSTGDHIGG
jgi:hypothetical protein